MKKRKPRGIKLDGSRSLDMCTCYSFHCDPATVSRKFSDKMRMRYGKGVHRACGSNPCTCKSSLLRGYRAKNIDIIPGEINEEVIQAIRTDTEKTYQQWADLIGVDKATIYEIKKHITHHRLFE
jgi:hypothetical protein